MNGTIKLELFKKFLEEEIGQLNDSLDEFSKIMEKFKTLYRDERRQFNSLIKEIEAKSKKANEAINNLSAIIKTIDGNDVLKTDTHYQILIGYLFIFVDNLILIKNNEKFENTTAILKNFIIKSKEKNISNRFLSFFDKNGELEIKYFYDYIKYVTTSCSTIAIKHDEKNINRTFISKEMLEERKEYDDLKEKEKKVKEEERKIKERKIKEEEKRRIGIFHSKFETKETKDVEKPLYFKYLDELTLQLRSNIIDLISLEELIEILKTVPGISKKKIEDYKEEYNKKIIERELGLLFTSLGEPDRNKLKNIINNNNGNNAEIYKIIKENIISKEYLESSIEEKHLIISNILNDEIDYEKPSQIVNTNILIFPYDKFFDDEVKSITSNNGSFNEKRIKESLNQQFIYLRTQNLSQMISNSSKAFHEIKETRGSGKKSNPLVIDGKLKAYRYGAKKVKVCIVKLSVSEKNQVMLKEKYNCEFKPHILLSFTLGNVSAENEENFYIRANKNAQTLIKEIRHISELFKKDFTKESFEEACMIIDSSLEQMKHLDSNEMHI